ncbi:hypothetical protein KC340_g13502 [Hortaea werneckii]|nr:hypothetical protein KC342_g13829 [Hortaea werneckii]KAI7069362.1 hypothetical protein KC339_g14849 [Hortaea werneckii]KAI7212542.1 hypothetical protein KC365_g14566 [Hortaea werneckii]KAI7300066.1 hypothetical protein KC340_g13502 [Hortaea werneckii]KAI7383070.1 hypothetical protein KC328_g11458 [Hortaea werneckii]
MLRPLIIALSAGALHASATPAVNVVTGMTYRATFEESDAAALDASPGVPNVNITFQGLDWSNTNLQIQKPAGTATTYYLIPASPEQFGQMPPVYEQNDTTLARRYFPPNGTITPAEQNQKVQLEGFYFGCSKPGRAPGYANAPVNCTVKVTGTGGIGGEGYFAYADYTPIIGDCEQLGSQMLNGGGCAGLAYVGPEDLVGLTNYGPFDSITFTLPDFLTDEANRTNIFVDDVSYSVDFVGV